MPNIISYNANLVPFGRNIDGTRVQMASSQQRQAVDLIQVDMPYVCTGLEFDSIQYAPFLYKKSNTDGIVVYIDTKMILIKSDTSKKDQIVLIDDRFDLQIKVGDHVSKNQCIAKKRDFVQYGQNALTGILPYDGYNYEDAIIISEQFANRLSHIYRFSETIVMNDNQYLLSFKDDLYLPIRLPGEKLNKGDDILRIKRIDLSNIENNLLEYERKTIDQNCVVKDVKITISKWNPYIKEFDMFIQKINKHNTTKIKLIDSFNLDDIVSGIAKHTINATEIKPKLKFKNKKVDLIIEYEFESIIDLEFGDKLSNRHGNKGVISRIIPNDEMPKLEDGRIIDILINPLGVPSRMNISQIYEMHTAECVKKIRDISKLLNIQQKKDLILKCIKILVGTKNFYYRQTYANLTSNDEEFINSCCENFYILTPPFMDIPAVNILKLMNLLEVKERQSIIVNGKPLCNIKGEEIKIGYGYMYWLKLNQLSNNKMAARSIGKYNKKYLQPIEGRKNNGGQRLGEMEIWAMLTNEAYENLEESLYTKSDDLKTKIKVLQNIITYGNSKKINENHSMISETMKKYLFAMRLELAIVEEEDELTEEEKIEKELDKLERDTNNGSVL